MYETSILGYVAAGLALPRSHQIMFYSLT